jgi:hypothetical protein
MDTFTDKVKDLGVIKGSLFQVIFGDIEDTVKANPRTQN